ncbi:AbiH family protein [Amedibacillus sp. YH-ame6]
MNGNTLYIIGNGFDCFHGLDTGVDRFKAILRTYDIYNEIENAEVIFEGYGVLWGNYEDSLSEIDLDSIAEENIIAPDYTSDHEYDRDGGIFNMNEYTNSLHSAVQNSLATMVEQANEELININSKSINFLNSGDAVLNFNYTSTLEYLYNIPKDVPVLHIHGCYELGTPLLFGFSNGMSYEEFNNKEDINRLQKKIKEIEESRDLSDADKSEEIFYYKQCYDDLTSDCDFYIESQKETIYDFYKSLKKELQLQKLKYFLNDFQKIENVVVMGHSMSVVDSEYMEIIDKILHPQRWLISQFDGDPSQHTINKYSFANRVMFYSLNSILSSS